MNKNEFLGKLDAALSSLPYSERKDILRDYEDHFAQGAAEGLSEEEISAKLGNPAEIASEYTSSKISDAKPAAQGNTGRSTAGIVVVSILLILGNLMFVLPLWCGLFAALIALVATGLAIFAAGVAVICLSMFTWIFFAVGLGLICLGTLIITGMCIVIGLWFKVTGMYCKANVRLAKGTL